MVKVYTLSLIGGASKDISALSPSEALKLAGDAPVSKISLNLLKTYQLNFGRSRITLSRKEALQFSQQMAIFLGVIPDFIQATGMAFARFRDKKAVDRRMRILRRKLGAEAVTRTKAMEAIGFPREFLPILEVAEENGNFPEAFTRISTTMAEQQELHNTVRNALITPIMTLVVLLAAFVVMLFFVFPKLMELFQEAAGTHPSAILTFDMFMVDNKGAVFAGLLAFAGVAALWLSSKNGRRLMLDMAFAVPPVKDIILIYRATKFIMAIEMPIVAAQPIKTAIGQILDSSSGKEKRVYRKILAAIVAGRSLGAALGEVHYFPEDFTSWLGSVADAGQLTSEITTVRIAYERLLKQRFETAKTFIGPILLVVAGGAILVMAGALYAPILDLVQSFMTQAGQ